MTTNSTSSLKEPVSSCWISGVSGILFPRVNKFVSDICRYFRFTIFHVEAEEAVILLRVGLSVCYRCLIPFDGIGEGFGEFGFDAVDDFEKVEVSTHSYRSFV